MKRAGAGVVACGVLGLCFYILPSVVGQSPPAPTVSDSVGFVPFTTTFHPNVPGGSLYQWQFDAADGADFVPDYSSEAFSDVSYTYQSAGSRTARLRVYDTLTGLPTDYDIPLTVYPPPVPPTVTINGVDPHYAGVGVPVTFSAQAVASPGRMVASYHWDFLGDGASEAASVGGPSASATYTYQAVGTYTVKVTAIDNGGLAGFATFTTQVSLPPVVTLAPVAGIARSVKGGSVTVAAAPRGTPYALIASATPDTGRTIVSYSWDFDGDGTIDLVQSTPATTDTESFPYPLAALYLAQVTVVDDHGISGSATLAVPVYLVMMSASPASVSSGGTVTLSATPYPPAGLSVTGYTWTFGDGTTATTGATVSSIAHVYVGTKILSATVAVTLSDGSSGTSPVLLISVKGIAEILDDHNPTVIASLSTLASLTLPADTTLRVGHEMTFTATVFAGAGVDGNAAVTTVAWDMDGDGIRDFVEDFTSSKLLQASSAVTYQYAYPGVFKVKVIAGTTFGQTLRGTFKVTVAQGTPPMECWLVQPHTGVIVEGNHVTVSARGAPGNQIKGVTFQFRPSGSGPWTTIAKATPPPLTALSVPWDVTQLSGSYDLQAVAVSSDGSTASSWSVKPVTVTVDSTQVPDQQETAGPDGVPQVRIQNIDPSRPDSTEISQDTRIEFPAHSTTPTASTYARCRIERVADDPHPVETRFQGITFIPGLFRRLDLGTDSLTAPAKVCMYVPTGSYGQALGSVGLGPLNSTSVDLTIYRFDDVTTLSWVPLFSHIRQPGEALVRASAMSMGDLGVGFTSNARTADGSSSSSSWSGCGALGIEGLILVLLLRGLRAARRLQARAPAGDPSKPRAA